MTLGNGECKVYRSLVGWEVFMRLVYYLFLRNIAMERPNINRGWFIFN